MATSGVIDGTLTVRQIGEDALQLLSVLGAGETYSGDDGQVIIRRLNAMLKSWQTDGVNLWRETDLTFPTAIGQATYTLSPRPLQVQEVRIDYGYQRPLQIWGWGEYMSIPNKAALGIPTAVMINRQRDDVTMTFWPVPMQVDTIYYSAGRVIEDVTDLDETLDIPQEWIECVTYNLAVKLFPAFGGQRIEMITQEAGNLYSLMRDFDRPSSIIMGSVR